MPAALAREFLAGGAREKREHFSASRCSLAPCVPRSQLGVATAAGRACREQRSARRCCGGVGRRAQHLASPRSTHARGAWVGLCGLRCLQGSTPLGVCVPGRVREQREWLCRQWPEAFVWRSAEGLWSACAKRIAQKSLILTAKSENFAPPAGRLRPARP